MVKGLKRQSGVFLYWTGWIHTILGFVIFWNPFMDIVENGVYNAVGRNYDRATFFWFIFFGLLAIACGHLMNWLLKKKDLELPRSIGLYLLVISVIGAIVLPISGFWLVLPQALIILKRS